MTGATMTLRDSDQTRALWPHRFSAELAVALGPQRLDVQFTVHNAGDAALDWSGTLHTFLALDARRVRLRGLGPALYIDRGRGSRPARDGDEVLAVPGHTDRAYLDAGPQVDVDDGQRRLVVRKRGFRDTVVWNPGPETSACFSDLAAGDHTAFVCVEAAEVRPVSVPAGGAWSGGQTVVVLPREGAGG
jgi:glucose-6-phosphate 1-epimerase